jgi:hypothetical protein
MEHLERKWNRNPAIFDDLANVLKEHLPLKICDNLDGIRREKYTSGVRNLVE